MAEALEIPDEATLAYCRQARRLRHRLKHSPLRLHRSLRELKTVEIERSTGYQPVSVIVRHGLVARATENPFDRLVENALEGSTLRYSRRLELLAIADRLGMERFDANLRIATVLHRAGYRFVPEPAKPRVAWTLVAIVAVQAIIFIGALCIWRAIS